jgi:hypothetical protein
LYLLLLCWFLFIGAAIGQKGFTILGLFPGVPTFVDSMRSVSAGTAAEFPLSAGGLELKDSAAHLTDSRGF